MGGTGSVARSQGTPAASGSAAKYEDKSTPASDGSKDGTAKLDEKPGKVEDARTITSEPAEPKGVEPLKGGHFHIQEELELIPNGPQVLEATAEHIAEGFIAEETDRFPDPTGQLLRNDNSASQIALFTVGDFVKVKNEDGSFSEGLLLEVKSSEVVVVDFGAEGVVKECLAAECELVVPSDAMEEGDQVQVQPQGSAMYFVGRISRINEDGTYDVVMEGDDPDDIETSVPESNIRKLMSRRALVVARWKRAALVVSSINNFQSFALDPNQFNASTRGSKPINPLLASVKAGIAASPPS